VQTATQTPADELSWRKRLAREAVVALRARYPQLDASAPAVTGVPARLLDEVWSPSHAAAFDRPPMRAPRLDGAFELGALLEDGPFFLQLAWQDGWVVDARHLAAHEHHPGTRSLGVLARFVEQDGHLVASSVAHADGALVTPGDRDWAESCRLVGAVLLTRNLLLRHMTWAHLATAGAFAVATRAAFAADHPIKALLWPHIHGTLDVNNTLAPSLVEPRPGEGVFGDVTNLSHAGVLSAVAESVASFDLRRHDPRFDRRARGVSGRAMGHTEQDALALWAIIERHVSRWVGWAYPSDEALVADGALAGFGRALEGLVPNGLRGLDPRTRSDLVQLCTIQVYTASVVHEIVGNLTWNYVPWPDRLPCRVYEGSSRMPRADVHQRFFNALFATNVPNRPLMSDWCDIATTPEQTRLWRTLQEELAQREREMRREPYSVTRLYPSELESAIAV
jgi:arachidonate 15-lipoxygenase